MRPILFSIGSFNIYSYGFFTAVGIIAAFLYMWARAKRHGLSADSGLSIGLFAIIFGYAGSKLLYFIVELPEIIADPSFIMRSLTSGFVVFGGLIGGVAAALVVCRIKKLNFMDYADLIFPSVALAQGFGRIGCFMAGCCYGRETTGPLGVIFPENPLCEAPAGVALIPTQLIMSVLDFANCAILTLYSRKTKKRGAVCGLYIINYSVGRFLVEFLRNDPRGAVGVVSTSQLIAIVTLILGVIIFLRAKPRNSASFKGAGA